MILQLELLPHFWEWLETNMGIHPTVHDKPKGEEFGRFMWGGTFCIVRSFGGGAVDVEEGATVEVHMSVPEKLEELERSWGHYWDTAIATFSKEQERDESNESKLRAGDLDEPDNAKDIRGKGGLRRKFMRFIQGR